MVRLSESKSSSAAHSGEHAREKKERKRKNLEITFPPGHYTHLVAAGSPPDISVVIPVLNDAEGLDRALATVQDCPGVESIVVDGGSSDESVKVAQTRDARILHSPAGRARQMNAGAAAADGTFLLFLHADTRLPRGFDQQVRRILTGQGVAAGAFQLRIDGRSAGLRLVERVSNWRSRYLQMPYGDQAIFLKAKLFHAMEGFPEMPIMEDFQLIRRLRRRGRIVIAPTAALTSARRWEELGVLRTTLINQWMILGFYLGVEPSRLAHRYKKV